MKIFSVSICSENKTSSVLQNCPGELDSKLTLPSARTMTLDRYVI